MTTIWRVDVSADARFNEQVAIQRPFADWQDHGAMGVIRSRPYYLRDEPEPYYQVNTYQLGGKLSGGGSFHHASTLLPILDATEEHRDHPLRLLPRRTAP